MLSLGERGNCALATGARGPTGRIKTIKQGGLVEGDHTALWAKDVPNRKKKKKNPPTHPPRNQRKTEIIIVLKCALSRLERLKRVWVRKITPTIEPRESGACRIERRCGIRKRSLAWLGDIQQGDAKSGGRLTV